MPSKHSALVVAADSAGSPGLIEALRHRQEGSPTRLTLLVPAAPQGDAWTADTSTAWPEAVARAEHAARLMRESGLDLEEAIVGDPDPVAAVGDVLHCRHFDEVILAVN
jgi:hypothetical protein